MYHEWILAMRLEDSDNCYSLTVKLLDTIKHDGTNIVQ